MKRVMDLGKLVNDPTRLRIIKLLLTQPMCACELMEILRLNQPCVSQHLTILKYHNLLKSKRGGKWIIYSISRKELNGYLKKLQSFVKTPLSRIKEYRKESRRLTKLKSRGCLYQKLAIMRKRT